MADTKFGTYRLLKRIAVGGTAEVFRAARVLPDGKEEPLVLKKILPQYARDPRFRQLFREEALVMASLEHPNIVRIRDFGEVHGTFFLALEHVDGADLDALLASEPGVVPPLAAYITGEICAALDYIHTRQSSQATPLRIVHRDVSPHNILISSQGEVKLADFGIAKSIIREDQTTRGTIKGKFDYMAPEQATPGAPADGRTDLFALGAVLYEMLFERPPFRGQTEVDTLERVRRCSYTLEESWLPPEHRPLIQIIRRCLQRAPDDRYPCAAEMSFDLTRYLDETSEVTPDLLSAWVQNAHQTAGEVDELVHDIFDKGRPGGGTAIVMARQASLSDLDAGAAMDRHDERVPDATRRRRQWLQMVLVALAASAVTLGIAWRFIGRSPSPSPPAAVRRAGTGEDARPRPDLRDREGSGAAVLAATDNKDASPASAPTPAPAVPASYRIRIRSRPKGATVLINGARVGKTPTKLQAPSDPFLVELRADGYRPWRRRFPALTEETRISARLQRLPPAHGGLTINSIPWANVYLDGRLLGNTPLRARQVPAGTHRIVLKDGRGKVLRTFVTRIRKGHTRVFSFDEGQR